MNVAYWIARNNQKVGPYSLDDAQRMMADGKLVASDLAWTEGMPNWGPAFDVIPAPQTPELPPPPAPEPLAPTRMMPVMRTPPTPEWQSSDTPQQPAAPQPAAPQPAPQQPITAPTAAVPTGQMRDFPAPQFPAQPAPAQPFSGQPFSGQSDPAAGAANQPFQPAPPPQHSQFGSPTQPIQQNSPYIQQPTPAPQGQFPPPPPPAQALPYQPYQPYPGQPMPGQPMPAQPMPYGAAGMQGAMVPPGMHWALVFVLGAVTFGIFYIIWIFKQVNFVTRIDPQNPSRKLYILALLMALAYGVLVGVAVATQSTGAIAIAGGLGVLLELGATVINLIAVFKMRTSLVRYYNTVEPIGLRLSGAMTFFFNILYFQYHFHRIARWKQTGMLEPQA